MFMVPPGNSASTFMQLNYEVEIFGSDYILTNIGFNFNNFSDPLTFYCFSVG